MTQLNHNNRVTQQKIGYLKNKTKSDSNCGRKSIERKGTKKSNAKGVKQVTYLNGNSQI